MNNKSLSLPPPSLCLSSSPSLWEVTPLSPYSPSTLPPSLSHTLSICSANMSRLLSLPLWASLSWHMFSLSAPPTVLLPSIFPNLRGGPLLPTQGSRESGGREGQQRRLVIITGRGSGQWPAWGGTVVRLLVLEHFFWTSDDQRTSKEAKEKDWLQKSGWEEKPWTDSFTCVGKNKKFSFHSFPIFLLSLPLNFGILGPILGKKKALQRNPVKKERKSTPLQHHLLLFQRQKKSADHNRREGGKETAESGGGLTPQCSSGGSSNHRLPH